MKYLILLLAVLGACAPLATSTDYAPQTHSVRLWQDETLDVSGWTYVATLHITVRGAIWDSNLHPADTLHTTMLMRETPQGPAILLVTRAAKSGSTEIFRYLGGTKTTLHDQTYRETYYGLPASSTDPEYSRYFAALAAAGHTPTPEYRVHVLDRLPTDTNLIRIMELTPGRGEGALPSYADLYTQERFEPVPRGFF